MIKMYGASWCRPCKYTREFFDENNVVYLYIDIEDERNQQLVESKDISSIPYIEVYDDNNELVNTFTGSIDNLEQLGL